MTRVLFWFQVVGEDHKEEVDGVVEEEEGVEGVVDMMEGEEAVVEEEEVIK